jgi:hypothetical protein
VYISTYGGLRQNPILYRSLAGTLGEPPPSPAIQEFLNEVRKRPQNFRQLLLTITFHPAPANSLTFVKQRFTFGKLTKYLIDEILFSGSSDTEIIDNLRRIRDEFRKRDGRFRQQIEAELKLRNEMIKVAGELGPQKLRPFLIEPLLPPTGVIDDSSLCKLARNFAQMRLPRDLAQRIINSEASEAQLTNLGRFLRRYAEVLQTKDPFFKALVEEERKHRQLKQEQEKKQQLEEERKIKQPRRRRP